MNHASPTLLAPVLAAVVSCGSPDQENTVQAASSPAAAGATSEIDPGLLAIAQQLQAKELAKPASTARRKDLAEGRHREALPDEEPVEYPDATGLWREGFFGHEPLERTFSRSRERVYVSDGEAEDTWLFVRNPVAPLQGIGLSTIVEEQVVLDLEWSDVLDAGFGPTWNELAVLGVTLSDLDRLEDTGQREEAFGLEFRVLAEPGLEIAWCDEAKLPLRVVRTRSGKRLIGELVQLELKADAQLLESPAEAHPKWLRLDISDWREEHHSTHGEGHDH